MIKVSFDFDSTLSKKNVYEYAKSLVERGIEVWICTSRFEPDKAPTLTWNDDLFKIANYVGIKREHIIFCNMQDKYILLKDKDFKFHIDDDNIELSFIRTDTKIKPVYLFGNKNWKEDCEKALLL